MSRLIPLLPLPNLVLFPGVVTPLHVFEPRYRAMVSDLPEGERLIALVLLRPGWEAHDEGAPAIHETACVARVAAVEPQPDGRFHILVQGEERVRIVDEVRDRPYRRAVVASLPETYPPAGRTAALRERIEDLLSAVRDAAPDHVDAAALDRILSLEPFGALVDSLFFHLPVETAAKQAALAETDVGARAEAAGRRLEGILALLGGR